MFPSYTQPGWLRRGVLAGRKRAGQLKYCNGGARIADAWAMDSRPTKFDPALAANTMLSFGHSGWLGMRYSQHVEQWLALELPWREDLIGHASRQNLASRPILLLIHIPSTPHLWHSLV